MSEQGYKWVGQRPIRPDGTPKVTGAATYGSDYSLPGMLIGKVLRSPHAHARLLSIDVSQAEQLPGVKSVMTGQDLPDQPFEYMGPSRVQTNLWHVTRNIMAREKVLYQGHAIAAVAAVDARTAQHALDLIKVEYELLPHVIDVEAAMADDAPLLFDDMITRGLEPAPEAPSNVAKVSEFSMGDVAAGFAEADVIVEKSYRTEPVHQGYIEPHACVAHYQRDGLSELWFSSQGHFPIRQLTARLVGMSPGEIKATPAEIGGGFGGKTLPYLEPVALTLSKKAGRPVKMVMSRAEEFMGAGPTSGSVMRIKVGAMQDGRIVAAEGEYKFQCGAFPQSPVENACLCGFAIYNIEHQYAIGYHVVCNRPKVAAYRAPGAPIGNFAVESTLDVLASELGMGPAELRLKNAADKGDPLLSGLPMSHEGVRETLEAIRNHPEFKKPLGPNQGRGMAAGFWHNAAGESGATVYVNADGTIVVATGSPDIGGSRASMAIMAAETFGIDYSEIRAEVHDTSSVPFTGVTGGSRVTYATGMAVVGACNQVIDDLRARAAKIWDVDVDSVAWEEGFAKPSSSNVGDFDPLSLRQLAAGAAATGGPIGSANALAATGHAPGLCAQFCDVEVDPDTGKVTILRFVTAQDAGRAIHPSYVEGQMQGAVAQGVGWALNEEYIYDDQGHLENPGFLDYRMPVASDLPFIETVIVEVPNPNHPYGVKGVAEAGVVPAMACIANAIADATGKRLQALPMSPPKVLAALAD